MNIFRHLVCASLFVSSFHGITAINLPKAEMPSKDTLIGIGMLSFIAFALIATARAIYSEPTGTASVIPVTVNPYDEDEWLNETGENNDADDDTTPQSLHVPTTTTFIKPEIVIVPGDEQTDTNADTPNNADTFEFVDEDEEYESADENEGLDEDDEYLINALQQWT